MTQKIILQIEIDDSQLDQVQAKVDKLVATLKLVNELKARLNIKDCDIPALKEVLHAPD